MLIIVAYVFLNIFFFNKVPLTYVSVLKAIGLSDEHPEGSVTLKRVFDTGTIRSPMAGAFLLLESCFSPYGLLRIESWKEQHIYDEKEIKRRVKMNASLESESSDEHEHDQQSLELRRIKEGVELNQKMLLIWPRGIITLYLAHHLHKRLGRIEEAKSCIDLAIENCPRAYVPHPADLLFELGCLQALQLI